MININAYGGNWLHILLKTVLKMTGSFGCIVTSKQWIGGGQLPTHTCKNLIPMVVTRAMANSSKNHALLMCRI